MHRQLRERERKDDSYHCDVAKAEVRPVVAENRRKEEKVRKKCEIKDGGGDSDRTERKRKTERREDTESEKGREREEERSSFDFFKSWLTKKNAAVL